MESNLNIVIPSEFDEDVREAQEALLAYHGQGRREALDVVLNALGCISTSPTFYKSEKSFQIAVLRDAGKYYLIRYKIGHERTDLNLAIDSLRRIVGTNVHDKSALPIDCYHLGVALRDRYTIQGQLEDLEAAIDMHQQSADKTRSDSPEYATVLNGLGAALRDRYTHLDLLDDLQRGINAHQQAVAVSRPETPHRALFLSNMGNALHDRYKLLGNISDLKDALEALKEAVNIMEHDDPDWKMFADNLGIGLASRYARDGVKTDIDDAIDIFRQVVKASSIHDPLRASYLNHLGAALKARYKSFGQLNDLEGAIDNFKDALAASHIDAPRRNRYFNNLGNALKNRYARQGKLVDLHTAIKAYRQAVTKTPPGDPFCTVHLANLGNTLLDRYARSHRYADLRVAIKINQRAAAAASSESPDRAYFLGSLGAAFSARYTRDKNQADLQGAIQEFKEAVEITPDDSPQLAGYLAGLGRSISDRYRRNGEPSDLVAAQSAYRCACERGLENNLEAALMGARTWGDWALERGEWAEAAEAYEYGEKAIEGLLEVQVLRTAKETWLREVQGVMENAAYALARSGDLEQAVVVIETGRARLSAEAMERNRRDLERLPELGQGTLLERYRQATGRWMALTTRMEQVDEMAQPGISDLRSELEAVRTELDAAVEAVRRVPGYENFLQAPIFAQIRAAAREASLVYIMTTSAGGLALIVPPVSEGSDAPNVSSVQDVWFDELTRGSVRERVQGADETVELGGYLGAYGRWRDEPSNRDTRTHWFDTLETTTRWLWDALMGSLTEALVPAPNTCDEISLESSIPQVILIPSGLLGLLPLHAAWTHAARTKDGTTTVGRCYALDLALFRYAPNARSLTTARALADKTSAERLLLCVEPEPVSASLLPAAKQEAMAIIQYWPKGSYTDRWHGAATHEELVTQLTEHSCLHFTGHASANWSEPQQGGLLMADDQVLTVRQLTSMDLPVRLAVLSACETGVPGMQLPDEVIGLPSALMEAGVAGVVASFWAVADDSTARLMANFHRLWRGQPSDIATQQDASTAPLAPADALRLAQIQLRDEGFYAHPFFWGAFAYTGL